VAIVSFEGGLQILPFWWFGFRRALKLAICLGFLHTTIVSALNFSVGKDFWCTPRTVVTQANEEDIHVPHASTAPPSFIELVHLSHSAVHTLSHDTVDGMMAPPGSALYHQVYNETYNCIRSAHLHTSVPPSKAQKLITRYLLLQ